MKWVGDGGGDVDIGGCGDVNNGGGCGGIANVGGWGDVSSDGDDVGGSGGYSDEGGGEGVDGESRLLYSCSSLPPQPRSKVFTVKGTHCCVNCYQYFNELVCVRRGKKNIACVFGRESCI